MAEQAQVKSVEALESLRAAFIVYQSKSRRAVAMAPEAAVRGCQAAIRAFWLSQSVGQHF